MTPAAHVVFTPSASPQSPLAAVDADSDDVFLVAAAVPDAGTMNPMGPQPMSASDNQDQLDGLTRDRLRAEAREDVRTYFLPAANGGVAPDDDAIEDHIHAFDPHPLELPANLTLTDELHQLVTAYNEAVQRFLDATPWGRLTYYQRLAQLRPMIA